MLSMRYVLLLSAAVVHFVDAVILRNASIPGISPTLEPRSDKTFFKKDYPSDLMPKAGKHYTFDHPYPAVQDTADFDRDFVKDENSDHGHWKAQMDYDVLRTKIREAEKKLAEARADLKKHDAAWHKASVEYTEASKSEAMIEEEMKRTELEAAKADKKVEELEGSASAHGDAKVGGAVGGAVVEVNKEMTDLEECKKKLSEAKQRLKDLLKEKEELDHKAKQEEAEKKAKAEADATTKQEMAEKQKSEDSQIRENEKAKAEDEVEAITQAEASWKKKVSEEENATSQAERSYDAELADVKKTEAELKQAAENLRKYRRPPHVDDDGGVYYKKDKSAAALSTASLVMMLATAIAVMGC